MRAFRLALALVLFATCAQAQTHKVSLICTPVVNTPPTITFNWYRSSGDAFTLVGPGTAPCYYLDTNVVAGTTYSYYVTATDGTVETAPSPTVMGTIPQALPTGRPYVIRAISPLNFTATGGVNPPARTFVISDSSPIYPVYTVMTSAPWVTATPVPRPLVGTNSVFVNIVADGLAPGTYSAVVLVSIADQSGFTWTNSPYSIPVTLIVNPGTAGTMTTVCSWLPASGNAQVWRCDTSTVGVSSGQAITSVVSAGTLKITTTDAKP